MFITSLLARRRTLAAAFVTVSLLASAMPATVAPPKLSASALRQIDVLNAIQQAKTPAQHKIDTGLHLGLLHQHGDARLASLTEFRFIQPGDDGRVNVDIALTGPGGLKPVLEQLAVLGTTAEAASAAYRVVTARVRFDDLESLAALPDVSKVRRHGSGATNQMHVSEGDVVHGAVEARSFFPGATGLGVKVCVLSDGVDSLATVQTSGDLPATVNVLPGQAGSGDEGTAMLEIVHDLAPDATLGFATASTSEAQFAQNILDLAASGCQVITDAYSYVDESPFEDGPVAQAVNTVTAAGVAYFSAAGDDGNQTDGTSSTWEGDFKPNGAPAVLAGVGEAHDFGDGGQSILVAATAEQVILTWAEHYDLTGGMASTDYDLFVLNSALNAIFDASTDTQDGVGGDDRAVEVMGQAYVGERLVVAQFASGTTSSTPMFNLLAFRGKLDPLLATRGATRGHSAAAGAFSVAAAPATAPGPFPNLFTSASQNETFSSDGPRRIILTPEGNEITPGNRTSTGGVVRAKPDLTAADGVSTSVVGFNPFSGTSAAAPHAAAIAALMKSAVPGLTLAQLRTALLSSAIDIEAPGTDPDTGAGIVMAHAALDAAGAVPFALLRTGAMTQTVVSGDADAAIEPNEIWELAIPLTNVGGLTGAGITATLTSMTPGVTVLAANASYGTLTPGAGSGGTPFRFRVDNVSCGGFITFALTATYGGGESASQTLDLALRTGGPGTPITYSYTGPVVPIPDGVSTSSTDPGAPAVAPLTISDLPNNIYDLKFRIDGEACSSAVGATTVGIDHPFAADLAITVTAPDGTSVLAINRTGGSGNNFCQTVLDDESTGPSVQSLLSGDTPFTGSFKPNRPLSVFGGKPANGTWQLSAQDFSQVDTGSIHAWSLIVNPAVCDAPDLPPTLVAPSNQTTAENQPLGPIGFTVGDDLLAPEALVVSATSSNQAVIADSGIALGGSGAARTITLMPVTEAYGAATITIHVSDGVTTVDSGFLMTVTRVNATPTISAIAPQAVPAGGTLAPVTFTVADDDDLAETLVVSATSSNLTLVPAEALVLGGSGGTRTIAAMPQPNVSGNTTITISVSDGNSSASTAFVLSVVSEAPPNAPGGLVADTSDSTVTLTWTASDGGLLPAGYVVETSRTPFGTTLPIGTVPAIQTTQALPLAEGTYFFRVRAQNSAGLSDPSNEAVATVGVAGTPGQPTAARATITGHTVTLAWQPPDAAPVPTAYRIEVGTTPGASDLGAFDTTSPVATLTGTLDDGSYVVRVRAVTGAIAGASSNEVAFTMGGPVCAAAPTAPVMLSPSVAPDLVTLTWLAPPTGDATSYRLSAGTAPGLADLVVFDTQSSATAGATTTPGPGTYYVFARAENACGIGPASNTVAVTVPVDVPLPAAPRSLAAAVVGRTVSFSWLPAAGGAAPIQYLLEAGSAPGLADYGVFPISPAATAVTFDGVPPASYFIRLRAVTFGGAGQASNEIVVEVP